MSNFLNKYEIQILKSYDYSDKENEYTLSMKQKHTNDDCYRIIGHFNLEINKEAKTIYSIGNYKKFDFDDIEDLILHLIERRKGQYVDYIKTYEFYKNVYEDIKNSN